MDLIGRILSSPEWVAAYGQILSAVITLVSVVVLVWQIWKTSRRSEKLDRRARVAALQSLINEVARIRKLADYYRGLGSSSVCVLGGPNMPVSAFETAFVSGRGALGASSELLKAVVEYLILADSVNAWIDLYRADRPTIEAWSGDGTSSRVCGILDRVDDCLRRELEAL